MNIQVEPWTVFMLIWWTIQENHFTFVPSLITLANIGQIERCRTEWWVGRYAWYSSFVALSAVGWIIFVPNIYRYFLALDIDEHIPTIGCVILIFQDESARAQQPNYLIDINEEKKKTNGKKTNTKVSINLLIFMVLLLL